MVENKRRGKTKYGLILLNLKTKEVIVLRRINYSLYDRINNNNISSHNEMALSMYPGVITECMYEFPKGNKEKGEGGFQCALREFSEETGIDVGPELGQDNEIVDYYVGKNNTKYKLRYFIKLYDFQYKNSIIYCKKNLRVLGDNFNIVICTKWINVRRFFEIQKLRNIIHHLDILCGLDKGIITENQDCQYEEANYNAS